MNSIPLFPASASTMSFSVDALFFFWFAIAMFFVIVIAGFIIFFAIRYHHRREVNRQNPPTFNLFIEIVWTGIPLLLTVALFVWGLQIYVKERQAPPNAMDIWVVGKQWMWKIQHPEGQSEINQLHIPVGRPIRLLMTSQDVIHSFFVPAFRIKQDVLPGRYTMLWFQADTPGRYHLFCAQYCGLSHADMRGEVIAMTPADYAEWLKSTAKPAVVTAGGASGTSGLAGGEQLFHQLACVTCHHPDGLGNGPSLVGIFNRPVALTDGRTVLADEDYLRESILKPNAKIVKGYTPLMPTFEGQVDEDQLMQLIAYIKSLKGK